MERWLSTWKGNSSLSCSVPVATTAEIKKRFQIKLTFRGFWHQLREHHLWIYTVTCPARSVFRRCERLTCVMALFCAYMFFVLVIYGIPDNNFKGIYRSNI